MTVVNPKSISGINSITTGSGSDNLLTIHTNDGTERVRVDSTGTTKIVTGIVTTLTATTGIVTTLTTNTLTANSTAKVGSGVTISQDGDVFTTGVSTFSSNVNIGVGTTGFVTITPDAATKATFRGVGGQDIIHITTGNVGDTLVGNIRGDNKSGIRIRGGGSYGGGMIELAGGLRDTDPAIIKFHTGTTSVNAGIAERVRIDSGGRLLIGTDSNRQTRAGNASYSPDVQIESTQGTLSITKINDSANPSRLALQKARGTQSSPTIVQADDEIGSLTFSGWDGDTFTNSAMIRSSVDGTPGDDDMPGNLEFYTTAESASTATERLRITKAGQVNIGAASPTASENGQLNVYITTSGGKAQIVHSAGQGGLRLAGTGAGSGSNLIFSNDYNSGTFSDHWCISHDGGDDYLKFKSGGTGGSQRVQIRDTGETQIFRDGNGDVFEYYRIGTSLFVVDNLSNESNTRMRIRNPNGTINYNSSSDYRLKENDVKITDGITRLKKLRPITFKWKSGTNTYDGFFAHEVSEACPMAVDGTKDQVATADDVTKGYANNVGDPIYQGIDHGKMVPVITAALQEAIAKIETLEAKVAALESS